MPGVPASTSTPFGVAHAPSREWLETLVWPEHDERRRNLRDAASVVAREKPLLVAGDANDAFEEVATQAPDGATFVVFHSAVLVYLEPGAREAFLGKVRASGAVWISNEGKDVLPEVAAQLPEDDGDRDEVIRKYEQYLASRPELIARLPELLGKTLGCFCAPKACHGHVLKRWAEVQHAGLNA